MVEIISMSLLGLIIAIALIGLLTWAVVTYIPMSPGMKRIITIVAFIAVIIFVLVAFGLLDRAKEIKVPKL